MSASDKRTNAQLIEAARQYPHPLAGDYLSAVEMYDAANALALELADRLERADAKIRDLEGGRGNRVIIDPQPLDLQHQLAVVLQYLPLALSDVDALNFQNDLIAASKP